MFAIWRILYSPIGMAFRALRDSETYAISRGVDPFRFKLFLFGFSAFFTGLAGGFLTHYQGAISPTVFNFGILITLLAMIVLGGMGSFWGPILGTAILIILPEVLRAAEIYRNLALGISMALIAVLAPQGLGPLISDWVKKTFKFSQKSRQQKEA
jgi:branched-chain amino acid transport system permease protein